MRLNVSRASSSVIRMIAGEAQRTSCGAEQEMLRHGADPWWGSALVIAVEIELPTRLYS